LPDAVPCGTVIVRLLVPAGVTLDGLKDAVTPLGSPEALSVTELLKLFIGFTLIMELRPSGVA
jgi:hypothetical protein